MSVNHFVAEFHVVISNEKYELYCYERFYTLISQLFWALSFLYELLHALNIVFLKHLNS